MAPSPFSPGGYGDRVRRGITQPTLGGPLDTRTRTFGGAYGNPGAQPLPFERPAQPPAVGLGMAPANQAQFAEQIHAQNPGGHLFGGTLPTMVSTAAGPRPGFMSEPMRDMSQKPQFPHQDYTTTPSGALTPRSPSQGMVMSPDQQAKLAAGRQAYLSQRQGVIGQRQAGVTVRAQQKAEARRVRRGLFSGEEQLARMAPEAFQGRMAAEAGQRTQADRFASDLLFRRDALAQQASEGALNRQSRVEAERIRAGLPVGQDANKLKSPFDAPSAGELAGLSHAERQEALKDMPKATRDRLEQELSRKGFLQRLLPGEVDQPGQAPISEALKRQGAGLYGWNPFYRIPAATINTPNIVSPSRNPKFGPSGLDRIPTDKLQEQPTDTPAQKRIKAELRAKRTI